MKNLDLSTLPAKKRKQIVSCLRAGIQLLYFLFLPSVFTAAFNGVKYIFTQLGQGEKIEMTAFVSALLLVCAFTIVFGRFFCGFACAFGSLGDAMHAIYGIICKKRKKKPRCIKPELAKKTGAGQIRHSASDCSLLLCRSLSESKRNKPVGCLFHAACGKFPTFLLYSRHCSSGADPGRHVL